MHDVGSGSIAIVHANIEINGEFLISLAVAQIHSVHWNPQPVEAGSIVISLK
jgi:hypothetical protein